jgi:hypothetical protein
MWYPGKAAFRAGRALATEWDDVNIGLSSTALGLATAASGQSSTALGQYTAASGANSTAMGMNTTASGQNSTAMGQDTYATGQNSTALGRETTATGKNSTVLGFRSHATGDFSFALGSFATTNGQEGSFVYADNASAYVVRSNMPNEFVVRASGGFRLRTATDANLSTGCNLPAGSGTWSCTSSRLAKADFMNLNGEAVLAKIARMPIQSWTYRSDPTSARHVGPTAQDFRAAFGLGSDDTSISLVDIDGINLLGVQALERRTHALERENAELRKRLERLEAAITRPTKPQ